MLYNSYYVKLRPDAVLRRKSAPLLLCSGASKRFGEPVEDSCPPPSPLASRPPPPLAPV